MRGRVFLLKRGICRRYKRENRYGIAGGGEQAIRKTCEHEEVAALGIHVNKTGDQKKTEGQTRKAVSSRQGGGENTKVEILVKVIRGGQNCLRVR